MTKGDREKLEHISLFSDERFAKKAWKDLMNTSLNGEAAAPLEVVDKAGNPTLESQIYQAAYLSVQKTLKDADKDRKPMKAEVIVEANLIRAGYDTSTFNLVLDRTAGKVKEEISIGTGQYEELDDEELALLVAHREAKAKEDGDK